MKKQVDSIAPETMSAFQWHSWPGNIRELRNMVECAVILSQDGVLHNPLHNRRTRPVVLSLERTQIAPSPGTWEDSDHALIVETLEEVGWVVGGPRGAAAKLGLKRTTLMARMKRLGISRPIPQEGTDVVGVARENAQI
jgi:formate hydrogenlyase transcriptional activator